ncbi:MAG: metal ABC transporter ATP-binding protein [Rickettsiaceae bacterium]|nr:metal ABC transporter ATP-binding protein [Rickettsiaceae bacterium]
MINKNPINTKKQQEGDSHIIFHNISKSFNGNRVKVLEDISFSIKKNNITALIGPNGAGKSTIAKLILGIEKPTEGLIEHCIESNFGYVPQKINLAINMPISVKGFIDVMASTSTTGEQYEKILVFARIEQLLPKQLHTLSGGQMQRVLLAGNLLNKPNFIILDEPTQGLDVETTNDFYLLLEQVCNDFDTTIFIISHDLHAVIKKADKVLCLNNHLCCEGKPDGSKIDKTHLPNNISIYHHNHDHIHYI